MNHNDKFNSIANRLPQRIISGFVETSKDYDVKPVDAWIERCTKGVAMVVRVRDEINGMRDNIEVLRAGGYRVGGRVASTYREALWFAQMAIERREIEAMAA